MREKSQALRQHLLNRGLRPNIEGAAGDAACVSGKNTTGESQICGDIVSDSAVDSNPTRIGPSAGSIAVRVAATVKRLAYNRNSRIACIQVDNPVLWGRRSGRANIIRAVSSAISSNVYH